jgi:hypothetical protein
VPYKRNLRSRNLSLTSEAEEDRSAAKQARNILHFTVHTCVRYKYNCFTYYFFCTDSANIFINLRPTCLLYLLTGHWKGSRESPPPLPLLDSLRQRQISRIASNLEVVSMIADIGQQQWLLTFFRFFNRTPMSRIRDCYGLAENSENPGGRHGFARRHGFDHFWAWQASTSSRYSTGECPPIKAGQQFNVYLGSAAWRYMERHMHKGRLCPLCG